MDTLFILIFLGCDPHCPFFFSAIFFLVILEVIFNYFIYFILTTKRKK